MPLDECSSIKDSPVFQPALKRKYDELSTESGARDAFTIQAHPSSASGSHRRLLPILLLDRSCLPLAYIDANTGTENFESRLFSARIAALEPELPEVQRLGQTSVLIVSSEPRGPMYAVERVQSGIYALCRLGNWVTERDIRRLQALSLEQSPSLRTVLTEEVNAPIGEWWRPAAILTSQTCRNREGQKQKSTKIENYRLCSKVSLFATPQKASIVEEHPSEVAQEQVPFISENTSEEAIAQNSTPIPEEVLRMIKNQYQEALYVSKSSLAYFAKGPLSRARAAFQGSVGSSTDPLYLVESLRSNVVSLAAMDKKYREALPNIVKELPISVLTEDEIPAIVSSQGKKARKSKKGNIGKDGLYPGEEASITRWWLSIAKPITISDSSDGKEDAIRTILLEQRARETQLQIILVLETMALEASAPQAIVNQEDRQDNAREQQSSHVKKSKSKKPQDLSTLLDLLIDRLCIWQSMRIDEGKESQLAEASFTQHGVKASDKVHLRDFCVDVVLPFYGARLPNVSKMICQKLGGPKALSPARPPLAKAASASQTLIRPGAALQRQQPRKTRTLERVLTDERSKSRKPSLSRSATDSIVPNLKREVSDKSLSAAPLHRLNVQKSKLYSQREVDLNAVSQAAEARIKKKANVEQELQGAIAALKRPNPRMAVREFVEAADKRAAASHSRKPKNPVRNLFAQGVQVTATPSRKRQKNFCGSISRFPASSTTIAPMDVEEVPPSSDLRAPDSLIRPGATLVPSGDECPRIMHRKVVPCIEQTPTRGPSKMTNPLQKAAQLSSVEQTPTRGPTKLSNPLRNTSGIEANEVFNHVVPPTILNQSFRSPSQPLGWSQLSGLPAPWPEMHETPSKAALLKQSYFGFEEESRETLAKPSRAGTNSSQSTHEELRETPVKTIISAEASIGTSEQSIVHGACTPTDDMGPSIYQSLGWDDVDELS